MVAQAREIIAVAIRRFALGSAAGQADRTRSLSLAP
jgi:hypothetical protein